jgi:hypothetical protein
MSTAIARRDFASSGITSANSWIERGVWCRSSSGVAGPSPAVTTWTWPMCVSQNCRRIACTPEVVACIMRLACDPARILTPCTERSSSPVS